MKRDMELVRKLLFALEASGKDIFRLPSVPDVDGYTHDQIVYHMRIMANAGLLHFEKTTETQEINTGGRFPYKNNWTNEDFYLSWQGHEFLDTIRDDSQWNKVLGLLP